MNHLTLVSGQQGQTMTTREIAELTGKRHPDVKRDVENMMRDLSEDVSRFARIYSDSMNRDQTEYALDRELTETLLTGYSAPLRRAVIARWKELENGAAPTFAIPQTFAEALRLAADQQETIQQQAAQLAIAAPKVAFVDQYVESSSGSKGFRQVAKLLKANEAEFRSFLFEEKIMYKLGGEWVPYQQHSDAGRFEVKTGTANEHAYTQAKFTAKGVEWVAGEWAKFNVRGAA